MTLSVKGSAASLVGGRSVKTNTGGGVEIEILMGTVCGGQRVSPGAVIEATPVDARLLINLGKARKYVEPSPEPKKITKSAKSAGPKDN